MENNLINFLVAAFPSLYLLFVPGTVDSLLEVINHFCKVWDSDEKFLDVYLLVLFTVTLVSFIAFFFVVRGLEFCA